MRVSILQWNIWYKEKIEDVASFLVNHKADIICLQELSIDNPAQTVKNAVTYIADKLGYHHIHQEIALEDEEMKLANAIFSRFPIVSSQSKWINEPFGTGHYDDEYRAYVEAEIKINSITVCVGTVHMSYTNAFVVTDRKLKETENLIRIIQNKDRKYILTGDFNAEPESEVINKISKFLKNTGPDYSQKTWTTKPFSYNSFEANKLDWRLDYVFASKDMQITSAEIIKTAVSDHLPVLVSFGLE